MKQLSIILTIGAIILHLFAAQSNYQAAIDASTMTDGSDAAIEDAMLQYGFNVDANDLEEPNMLVKIQALYIK